MVAHGFSSTLGSRGRGISLSSRLAGPCRVPGQPGLYREALAQKPGEGGAQLQTLAERPSTCEALGSILPPVHSLRIFWLRAGRPEASIYDIVG